MTLFEDQANLRLLAGRARAVEIQPYLSTALYAMKPVREKSIRTLGVDKFWRMYWNPEFVLTLTVDQAAACWLHEVGHLLRTHSDRFTALNEPMYRHPLFNKAGDAAINQDLREANVVLPKIKAIYPETIAGGQVGMMAEEFYRLLLNTPEADKVEPQKAELVLFPSALITGRTQGKVIAGRTRRGFLDRTDIAVTVTDAEGAEVSLSGVAAHDRRTVAFTIDDDLPEGSYDVSVTSGTENAQAAITVVAPTISLRPDHITSGWTAPYTLTIEGRFTQFTPTATVTITHAETGAPVATSATEYIGETFLNVDIEAQVADDLYTVTVTDGAEVYTANLPIGLPFLDIVPNQLPVGHGTPYPIAAVVDDFVFDANTNFTLMVVTPMGFEVYPDGTLDSVVIKTDTTADFSLSASLPEGQYVVVANSATGQVSTGLTIAPPSPSTDEDDGSGGGQGSGDESNDDDGNGDDESSGGGSTGEGDGEGDGEGQPGGSGGGSANSNAGPGHDPLPGYDDCGSGAGGPERPWDKGSDTTDGAVDEGRGNLVRQQTARAVQEHIKARGNVPGGWTRWANSILKPQVDWRKELRSVVRRTCATVAGMRDYTYSRPGRRSGCLTDVVTPAMRAPRPPTAVAILDTSGSVSDTMLGQALGDIKELIKQVSHGGGDGLKFIACDAAAAEMQSVRGLGQIDLSGGGGTDMRVGIEAAAALNPKADIIITFTDGYTPWPEHPPKANPRAKYIAVLLAGDTDAGGYTVPKFMHKIVVDEAYLRNVRSGN